MNIMFLTIGKRLTPSTRFRVKQYIDSLKAAGVECDARHIPHAFFRRLSLLKGLRRYDAVIIQKKLFSPLMLSLIKRANPNIIYDFDDLVTAEHPMHESTPKIIKKNQKNSRRFNNTLRAARGIIAGSNFLAETARVVNSNVAIIPTPVDTKALPRKQIAPKNKLTIGWIGTKSNLFYLDNFDAIWSQITKKFPGVVLKIVCNKGYKSDAIRVVNKRWSAEDELSDLLSFDIGIMPLTDDDWSRGKCGFKLLQYMGAGLPTVASPVGANIDIVDHGVNGFLAKNDDDWVEYISLLLADVGLRGRHGTAARKLVEAEYSVDVCAEKLISAIQGFLV